MIWIILLTVALVVGIQVLVRRYETSLWNGGVCTQNGIPWEVFDMDSGGSVGCKAGDEVIWVSPSVTSDLSNLPENTNHSN